MSQNHVRKGTCARARHLGILLVQKANMLQTRVGSSASTAAGEHMQTWRLLSIARAVRLDSIRQRRVVRHALHALEVPTVHQELLSVHNATWESMGEAPTVSHAPQDCTQTFVVPLHVSTALVVKFQTPKPLRVKTRRGSPRQIAQ